jgi:hypothetical protein
MKRYIFWDKMAFNTKKVNQSFGGIFRRTCYLLHAGFLLRLFFHPQVNNDIFPLTLD